MSAPRLFDTHAHYDSRKLDADRDAVLSGLPDRGVGLVVNPGCDLPSSRQAVERTLQTKAAWFWGLSRRQLWNKGECSGNFLHVWEIKTDCDTDTLLYLCKPDGPNCHTGSVSC